MGRGTRRERTRQSRARHRAVAARDVDRPRDALAWVNLAESLLAQRTPERRADAFAAADRACTLAPRDPDMRYMRGEALGA